MPDGYEVPEAASELVLGGATWTFPAAGLTDAAGLLDNSTLTAAYGLFVANPADGVPLPRYAIINLAATDGAGHKAGPHGGTRSVSAWSRRRTGGCVSSSRS